MYKAWVSTSDEVFSSIYMSNNSTVEYIKNAVGQIICEKPIGSNSCSSAEELCWISEYSCSIEYSFKLLLNVLRFFGVPFKSENSVQKQIMELGNLFNRLQH